MWFIVSIILFLAVDLFLLIYLVSSEYFAPFNRLGDIDMWNISVFVVMVSAAAGLVISLLVYLLEKFMYCGRREFPRAGRAVRFGMLTVFCLAVGLLLHIFHFLNFGIILVLFFLAFVGVVLVR